MATLLSAAAPRVGIALAAFEPDPAFLAEQLASIVAQTHTAWRCIVRLDSPLAPLRAEPALTPFLDDPRFTWAENPTRLGHLGNFSSAMASASEGVDAVACADQDDVWDPDKLEVCVARLAECPPLALVHHDMRVGGADGEASSGAATVWQQERRGVDLVSVGHLIVRNVVNGASCVIDAELVRRFPRVPPEARFHDHWYAALAAAHGGVHAIRRALMTYRLHGGNVVGSAAIPGLASTAPGLSAGGAITKARREWADAAGLRDALAAVGVQPSAAWRPWLGRFPDLGLGLAALSLVTRGRDPKLARACLKKSLGRLFSPCR